MRNRCINQPVQDAPRILLSVRIMVAPDSAFEQALALLRNRTPPRYAYTSGAFCHCTSSSYKYSNRQFKASLKRQKLCTSHGQTPVTMYLKAYKKICEKYLIFSIDLSPVNNVMYRLFLSPGWRAISWRPEIYGVFWSFRRIR